jgi:hypothetical protein
MAEAGKGSRPRPFSVDQETFESNWETIFGRSKEYFEKSREEILEERITDYSDEDQ